MASNPQEENPQQPLKYQTWTLKVSIHCNGCRKKIWKLLRQVEGVYTTEIDQKQQKAIVTGNVDAETLIKQLVKNGKPAEMWPESPADKEKNGEKGKDSGSDESSGEEDNAGGKKTGSQPENGQTAGAPANGAPNNVGEKKKKKKKKKKKSGNGTAANPGAGAGSNGGTAGSGTDGGDQVNLVPPNQYPYIHQYPIPPSYLPHQVYVVSYNAANQNSGPSYITPHPAPYTYVNPLPSDYVYYPGQSTPLDMLSDENPHACSIM